MLKLIDHDADKRYLIFSTLLTPNICTDFHLLLNLDLSSLGQGMSLFSVHTLAHLLTPYSMAEVFRHHYNNSNSNNNEQQAKYPIRGNGGNKGKTKKIECYCQDLSTHATTKLIMLFKL